ncbi:MAG: hypothetical protein LUH04_16590 [Clostridium sp.]|nr:hypothetical protein [Clostridium sp.]
MDPDIISREKPTPEEVACKRNWIENIREMAFLPNVVCKISGLNPAGAWRDETLRPAVDAALMRITRGRGMRFRESGSLRRRDGFTNCSWIL